MIREWLEDTNKNKNGSKMNKCVQKMVEENG